MVKVVMSIHEEPTSKTKVGSVYSDKFFVRVGVYQVSILSTFLFANMIDVVTEIVRKGLLHEILFADD